MATPGKMLNILGVIDTMPVGCPSPDGQQYNSVGGKHKWDVR